MGEAFFQALKWFISAALIIGGIGWITTAESSGEPMRVMLAIASFGFAYIMSGSWRSLPSNAGIISVVFVLTCGFFTRYLPGFAYVNFGIALTANFYLLWVGLLFFIGIPFMMFVFHKFNE